MWRSYVRGGGGNLPRPHLTEIPDEIGEYFVRETLLVRDLGWDGSVRDRRGQGYFSDLIGVEHPVRRILRQYLHRGSPVFLSIQQCTEGQQIAALER